MSSAPRGKTIARLLVLGAAYVATGWLGLSIPYAGRYITLVWIPAGIALAALLRWGPASWPAVTVAALLVNLSAGAPWPLAAGIAAGNTIGPWMAARWLVRVGFRPALDRSRDVGFFIVASGAGMAVTASWGSACLHLAGSLDLASLGPAWLSWWMGDSVGALLAGPPLLALDRRSLGRLLRAPGQALLWLVIACPVAWLGFLDDAAPISRILPMAFLTLPLLTWAALRFGVAGAALAALGFSLVAASRAATGHGLFQQTDPRIGQFLLWSYMAALVVTGLLITALQAERRRVERALRESEIKLRGLYELSPVGIALVDDAGRYVEFNPAFQRMSGYPAEELRTLDVSTLFPERTPTDAAAPRAGRHDAHETEIVRKDGSLVPVRQNGVPITRADGRKLTWSMVEDVTESRRVASDLRVAAAAFDSYEGMIVTDAETRILRVNRAFTELTGYAAEDLVGQTPRLLQSGRHGPEFYRAMWRSIHETGGWQGEIWDRRKNGEVYPKWLTISTVRDEGGAVTHYLGAQVDITLRKLAEERIEALAFFDQLTGLANRTLLLDRLTQARTASGRSGQFGALLLIDLDHFKTLNDTLGHDVGDALLRLVAARLTGCVREGDTVARLGGDEFVVLLGPLGTNEADAARTTEALGETLLAEIGRGYQLGDVARNCTASVGATLFCDGGAATDDLMKQADLAMYRSKDSGRNALHFFDPDMERSVLERAALEADLRQAIEGGQISLHYQAQVDREGRVTGAEVLARWNHASRGMVPPCEFIRVAEETGLILPLGRFVLESACAQLARWAGQPALGTLSLAVNVSARQFRQPDFVAQASAAIDESGADPRRLRLELTESLLIEGLEELAERMTALKARGVGFALDDFGTGYSSLSYLKRLPIDELKIDGSVVRDILTDPNDAAIARTVVALARSLGLGVIAEGVETEPQRAFLATLGCDAYQGHLFSKPVPVEAFEQLVRSSAAGSDGG